MRTSLHCLAAGLLVTTLSGCLVTRADLEREPFEGGVATAAPTTAVVDVLFSDDEDAEDVDRVQLASNRHAGVVLLDSLTLWLGQAGYDVKRRAASVGLSTDSLALVSLDMGDATDPVLHSGPVSVDPLLRDDALLFAAARAPEDAPRALAGSNAQSVVAVLRVRGRNVAMETSAAQAALTGLLTLGRKADFDRSALRAELFLLDADTGALVWARGDEQDMQTPDVVAATVLAKALAAALPPAGLAAPSAPLSLSDAR